MEQLAYRKGRMQDLPRIVELYEAAKLRMEQQRIFQWDARYPDETILREDLELQQLYITEYDHRLAAVFILNQEQDPQYRNGAWIYRGHEFLVLHRFCVHPGVQNKGIGASVLSHLTQYARGRGMRSIRLDAFSENPYSFRLYTREGFQTVGLTHWRKGLFFLMEKRLPG